MIAIVTGSRSLADSPDAVTWAREILSRELASATLVVAGDARGPDRWAHEIAQGMVAPIDCERWMVAGLFETLENARRRDAREQAEREMQRSLAGVA